MMKGRGLVVVLMVLLGAVSSYAGEAPEFATKPTVKVEKEGVRIEFAVSKPTDVAVAILDDKGAIVRHLAAGMLGTNAPLPLAKNSLEQSLLWDRKDDTGGSVPPGAYTVKVGIGLKPIFDNLLGWKPETLGSVRGLAVGDEGELYVLNTVGHLHSGDGTTVCQVFDRQGKYLRTIMPYPGNLFPEKTRGFGVLDLGAHGRVPFIHHAENRSIYPLAREAARQQMLVMADGRLVQSVTGDKRGRYLKPGLVRLLAVGIDGSSPAGGVLGPMLARGSMGDISLALALDGKSFYATGLVSGPSTKRRWHQVVYRCTWQDEEAVPFLGKLNEPGSDEEHFNKPGGVAVDAQGNVYVTDRDNDRVAVFDPQGAFLGSLPVEKPDMLAVHRKSGAIYVLSGTPIVKLLKFTDWKQSKPVAEIVITRLRAPDNRTTWPVLALDDKGENTIVWVGSPTHYTTPVVKLLRIVDRGGSFAEAVEIIRGKEGLTRFTDIAVDRQREEIYLRLSGDRYARINGRTGESIVISPPGSYSGGTILTVGDDGNLYMYAHNWPDFVARFDRELKPLEFAPGVARFTPQPGSMHLMARGIVATRQGEMYIMQENSGETDFEKGRHVVNIYGPDGKLKRQGIIPSLHRGACSVKLDARGNIYVASNARPRKALFPPEFKGRVPEGGLVPPYNMTNWYPVMYGSIIKFGPEGGAVWPDIGGQEANFAFGKPTQVKEALWQYLGTSPVPAWYGYAHFGHYINGCECEQSRFDVDGFGRVFLPDVGRFRVVVLDTNGNEILAIGAYGNQDSRGPKSPIPEPAIAFAWPSLVGVSDEAIYVGDVVNRRVVRVKLTYAAEATCKVK